MTRRGIWSALPFFLALALPVPAQEAERRDMLDKVGGSVVAIRNEEGYGSGMVLDEQGTILTSAHVVVSPLPYRVEAELREKNRPRPAFFSRVMLIGVHPSRDLALIRVDPSEHSGNLLPIVVSKERAVTSDVVYAIGYPSSRGGARKVCTSGEITGVDRFVDMPGYFECSAEIHPGNSGGPILNKNGEAMGVVTWGQSGGKATSWAIPLFDFRPDQFIPLERRPKDPAAASALLRHAEETLKMAKEGLRISAYLSEELFQLALLEDISNPDTYFKIGMLKRHDRNFRSGAAYLMRSIQIQPWNDAKDLVYHELGACLVAQNRIGDALAVWNEAAAKFPGDAARVWDALAVAHFEAARFLDAACASRASLRMFGDRAGKMNDIYEKSRRRLDADAIAKLTEFETRLDGEIQESRKTAERAQQDGKRFMTSACEALVKSYEGVQKEATGFNFSSLGRGPQAPKPIDIPDKELIPLFVRSRIAVAGEHLQDGKIKLATEVLEDVIQTYPNDPETEAARDLLKLINKKK